MDNVEYSNVSPSVNNSESNVSNTRRRGSCNEGRWLVVVMVVLLCALLPLQIVTFLNSRGESYYTSEVEELNIFVLW